jgi:hypothetical protein
MFWDEKETSVIRAARSAFHVLGPSSPGASGLAAQAPINGSHQSIVCARAYAAFDAVLLASIKCGVPLKVGLQVADLASELVITGECSAGSAIAKACQLLWRHRRPGNRP